MSSAKKKLQKFMRTASPCDKAAVKIARSIFIYTQSGCNPKNISLVLAKMTRYARSKSKSRRKTKRSRSRRKSRRRRR